MTCIECGDVCAAAISPLCIECARLAVTLVGSEEARVALIEEEA